MLCRSNLFKYTVIISSYLQWTTKVCVQQFFLLSRGTQSIREELWCGLVLLTVFIGNYKWKQLALILVRQLFTKKKKKTSTLQTKYY